MKKFLILVFCLLISYSNCQVCNPSVTTASGSLAPSRICSGALIFEDNFDELDQSKWLFDNTLGGGGNWEFQWYPGYDNDNAYVKNGILNLVPTLTSEKFGEDFIFTQRVRIPENECTQADWDGCDRQGTPDSPINPIRSTRIDSRNSFRFMFGELEIRAKMPTGDWLWPALWMMPFWDTYGGWPSCGEIDLLEMRGNRDLYDGDINVGIFQGGSTQHFGPDPGRNGWPTAHFTRNQVPAYSDGFHRYRLRWTPTEIQYFYDNYYVGTVKAGDGFWKRGGWQETAEVRNPWVNGTIMAPFDHEFYVIMNLAVGGLAFFPDHFKNLNYDKPWSNSVSAEIARRDFWNGRNLWEPTWKRNTTDSHMQVDYVRVWAL